MTLETRGDI